MQRKWMSLSAVIVMGAAFAVGCGANNTSSGANAGTSNTASSTASDNQKPVTITFYEAMGSALGKELQSLTNQFQQQNPNIKVDLVYNQSYSTQQQKLTAAIAAKKEPTMAQVQETWETEYNNNNLIYPAQSYVPQSTIDDLMPIWKDDNSYGGKLISAPFNKSAYVLYYNTDDFTKAGITTPPTTWDQLEQDAIKITKATGTPGLGLQGNYYTFEMFLKQAGGGILNADNTKASFGGAAGTSALSFMNKLANQDKAAKVIGGNAYLSDGFNTGAYAMDLDTVAAMTYYTNKNLHWAAAALPAGKQAAVPTSGTNLVVFNTATDAQKQAAAKYINFLISVPSTIEWAEKTGYLPVRQSALSDSSWKSFIQQHPNQGVAPAEMTNAYFSPRVAALYSGEKEASTQVGNMLSQKQDVSTTLKNMVQAVNKALAGN